MKVDEKNSDVLQPDEAVEPAAGEQSAADGPEAVIEQQATQIAELEKQILRLHADFDNYRKRTLRDREEQITQAEAALLRAMLPVLDNFERALSALPADQAWAEGISLVHRQWMQVLAAQGLAVVDCAGPFDPNVHEAVMRDESGDEPDGTILQELQRGYQYKGRLLRPSMVKVAVGPAGTE